MSLHSFRDVPERILPKLIRSAREKRSQGQVPGAVELSALCSAARTIAHACDHAKVDREGGIDLEIPDGAFILPE